MEGPTLSDKGLAMAACEVSATRPAMFLGLPRKLSTMFIFGGVVSLGFVEDLLMGVANVFVMGMVWAAVREQVSRDYWGFDNFLSWLRTDPWFADTGGEDGWGGARLCALPLSTGKPVGVDRAAR